MVHGFEDGEFCYEEGLVLLFEVIFADGFDGEFLSEAGAGLVVEPLAQTHRPELPPADHPS